MRIFLKVDRIYFIIKTLDSKLYFKGIYGDTKDKINQVFRQISLGWFLKLFFGLVECEDHVSSMAH